MNGTKQPDATTRVRSAAWEVARRLILGVALIGAAAAVLLLSDVKQRRGATATIPRIAIVKYASRPMLDEIVEGMLDALRQGGFVPDNTIAIKNYSAEGDMATAAAIAKEITDGRYDLVLTASTPCLQAVAQANRQGRTKHIFGGVTDPYGSGVGIDGQDPARHPGHLAGIGTFQPVEPLFRLMKKSLYPELAKVGVVWNPSEACSLACTEKARAVCAELGVKLVEATVDKSSDVPDAANSLTAQGVDALWIGGDNTVDMAIDAMVSAARKARIPVVSHAPSQLSRGVVAALGADYREVGVLAGRMAVEVLRGKDISELRVENVVPEKLGLNLVAMKDLAAGWKVPPEVLARANLTLDAQGLQEKKKANTAGLGKQWKVFLVRYVDAPHTEDSTRGIFAGFAEAGLKEGTDFTMRVQSAQGQITTLNGMIDLAKTENADMVMVLCTPTLQAAINRLADTPIVYTTVARGVEAGAGRSETEHRANVTGVDTLATFSEMIPILKQLMPSVKRVGTLFSPGEVNSVANKNRFREELAKHDIELVTVPVDAPGDVSDAILSLNSKGIDAICQVPDNMCASCFTTIIDAGNRARLPVFSLMNPQQARLGALLVLSRDYYDAGREAALVAARVMRGENPAKIPFSTVKKVRMSINLRQAEKLHLTIPTPLIQQADEVVK